MNIKAADYEIKDLAISSLGEARFVSPYKLDADLFADDETKVLFHTNTKDIVSYPDEPRFELAGPRAKLFFAPKAAI